MHKAETYHPKPWLESVEGAHGTSGPIHTEPHDLAPISKRILDSFISKGIPYKGDLFSTGEVSHGCGHVVRTVHNGLRSTAADYLTKGNRKDNITILCNTSVDKVIIESHEGGLKATGVAAISTVDKSYQIFHAIREVIVSGGAYCNPAILLRSGIGPKGELDKHGIPCKINLPGVGNNLMDHLVSCTTTPWTEKKKRGRKKRKEKENRKMYTSVYISHPPILNCLSSHPLSYH